MRTTYFFKRKDIEHRWHLIDAEGQILGRLAAKIATILMGKDKPEYTPNADVGDYVVVVNSKKIHLTGRKLKEKFYTRYSGYPGGLKKESAEGLLQRRPTELLRKAVKGMLPKNRLGRRMFLKLKVYPDANHRHPVRFVS